MGKLLTVVLSLLIFMSKSPLAASHIVFLRSPEKNTWLKAIVFPLGCAVGLTAYAMSLYAVGGWIECSAVLLFNSLFLFSLTRACLYWKNNDVLLERRWLTRAVFILLGIATTRPVMGIFFALPAV